MNLNDFELVSQVHSDIASIEKDAFAGTLLAGGAKLVGKAALGTGKLVARNPGKALGTGLGGYFYGSDIATAASKAGNNAGRLAEIGTSLTTF